GVFDCTLCALSKRVHRLSVPHFFDEERVHRIQHLWRDGGCSTVIQVNGHLQNGINVRVSSSGSFVFFLPLFVPGHLNCFQLLFIRVLCVAAETIKLQHPSMEVRESHRQRIYIRMLLQQSDRNFFHVGPADLRHLSSPLLFAHC